MREQDKIEQDLSEYRVRLGAPLLLSPEEYREFHSTWIRVPNEPHVFFTKKIRLKENNLPLFTVENAMVMLGHGITTGVHQENWYFLTGKPVIPTIESYEKAAKIYHLPPIDVLIICREEQVSPPDTKVRRVFTTRETPYIFADSTVVIGTDGERYGNWLKPGEGVEFIAAEAKRWEGIDRWYTFWQNNSYYRQRRLIPDWAKQPRI